MVSVYAHTAIAMLRFFFGMLTTPAMENITGRKADPLGQSVLIKRKYKKTEKLSL
jgi:hypothetical protein